MILLFAPNGEKLTLLAALTPDLVERGLDARSILREATDIVGGSGGGRPDLAEGGGEDSSRASEAADQVRRGIADRLA